MTMPLKASVCIPTYNRRERVLAALRALDRQTIDPDRFEVIVLIDGATDGTEAALAGLKPGYALRWSAQPNAGSSAARNAAARLARHEVIIFLDDDHVPVPELVAAHLEEHERNDDVIVQGCYPLAPGYDRMGAALAYELARTRTLPASHRPNGSSWMLWAGNFSVRKQTFRRVGGFDEDFRAWGSEDTDFGLRLAALSIPLVVSEAAVSQHRMRVGYGAFRRQSYSAGRAVVRLSRKHGRPLNELSPNETTGWLSSVLARSWSVSPAATDAAGRMFSACLWLADRARARPLQLAFARVVRRIYKVGGITEEVAVRIGEA
ncbi:MAG TPA: glycosyltransferase [Candidatus Dormibacteraeota bacterium]|nr:glycosyltransferase [Candidatus Dormibacteraeota bacterium]